ncbi:CvfB family protein [Clostridium gasigenes]|uniref:DNA-binding protein n=1 Tax=Clostridium gasigenes TaxID=94869 RepID=A0A1H0VEG7_9CLOT|nr:S1-like domain-containing RNA-binding protein [Clostridium gasigenes]MBB6624853.1 DNA-binding protein [Clostridium gasigenes]MBB6714744.1 DNA-binding protein [Clostridium gasigenes]MBU3089858.1 DNA-binding protein [Clostridium gasigenes]MBU3105181.1 DNA-binding protein [Clostridium gasigenes]MBU3107603.1 DNA-binding protein [Clostridium gasigenes]
MLNIGEYHVLKAVRKKDYGYFLQNEEGDSVLLPTSCIGKERVRIDDVLNVFVYKDSLDRPVASLAKPFVTAGEVGYLKVVMKTEFGAFISIGLDRDIFVPIKEQRFEIKENEKYLFYIYVDKTGRLAGTTDVEPYLRPLEEADNITYKVGDEMEAVVYSATPAGTLNVAIDCKYKGLVLPNEYFQSVYPGIELKLRVKRLYEDGVIGFSSRQKRLIERSSLQESILKHMDINGGFMAFNDKSAPEDIKATFNTSKNYFKMALGGLMKEGKIAQDLEGTRIVK